MVGILGATDRKKISVAAYSEFQKHWIMYALQEKRYGQAFCDHFGIDNATPLYHFKDEKISRRWIDDNYLE